MLMKLTIATKGFPDVVAKTLKISETIFATVIRVDMDMKACST